MTATNPLPPHGTAAHTEDQPHTDAKYCRCPPCHEAKYRYNKQRALDTMAGRPYTVTAGTVADHVRQLLDAGASIQGIADAAGSSHDTVSRIINDPDKPIFASSAAKILAVTAAATRDDFHQRVDSITATRRVRALMAAGHAVANIQHACDPQVDRTTMSQLINGTLPRIRVRTNDAVAVAYDRLAGTAGASAMSRNRALRNGWAVPAAWDGIDMSDPAAFPDFTGHCGTPKGYQAHRGGGIPACRPCKDAEAEASAERKAKRAAAARLELTA